MAIDKDTIGLAGEFAVASELCKRGIYTQLTLGNKKRTDLLVEKNDSFIKVEVKSKQGGDWPSIKGIYGKDSILIFVDFQGKAELERPDFYVLNTQNWIALTKQRIKDEGWTGVTINNDNTPIWKTSSGKIREGLTVKLKQIEKFKEAWEKCLTSKVRL